jgi:hypothetical protein
MELKRFIITNPKASAAPAGWVATIYAERLDSEGTFWIGSVAVAESRSIPGFTAGDSSGRVTVDPMDFAKIGT